MGNNITMFKAVIFLKRREDKTHDEFAHWWLKEHKPRAEQLPKLRRGVFNLIAEDMAEAYDGISELWFDSQEDFEAAYASDIGKAVAADSMQNVSARERMFVTEHSLDI